MKILTLAAALSAIAALTGCPHHHPHPGHHRGGVVVVDPDRCHHNAHCGHYHHKGKWHHNHGHVHGHGCGHVHRGGIWVVVD